MSDHRIEWGEDEVTSVESPSAKRRLPVAPMFPKSIHEEITRVTPMPGPTAPVGRWESEGLRLPRPGRSEAARGNVDAPGCAPYPVSTVGPIARFMSLSGPQRRSVCLPIASAVARAAVGEIRRAGGKETRKSTAMDLLVDAIEELAGTARE